MSKYTSYDWLTPECRRLVADAEFVSERVGFCIERKREKQRGKEMSTPPPPPPTQLPTPTSSDFTHTFSGSRGLFGVPFERNAFGWGDVQLLNWILASRRDVVRVCEFGTYTGVTSLYLGMAMAIRGGKVDTYDIS